MVFCILVLVTIPSSSCRTPRSRAVSTGAAFAAPAVSFSITPSSIQSRAATSWSARNRASLPAASSTLPPVPSTAENAAGKSARTARPAGFRARSCSVRDTSRCLLAYVPPLQFLRPRHKLRPDRQLVRRQTHRLLRRCQIHAGHLKHHPARLHHRHPLLWWTFALAHSGFRRLLGVRLVRENPDPQFSAALDEPGNRYARGLNLPVGNPGRLERLQSVLAKRQRSAAPRFARAAPALLLAVLNFFRHQHNGSTVSLTLNLVQLATKS